MLNRLFVCYTPRGRFFSRLVYRLSQFLSMSKEPSAGNYNPGWLTRSFATRPWLAVALLTCHRRRGQLEGPTDKSCVHSRYVRGRGYVEAARQLAHHVPDGLPDAQRSLREERRDRRETGGGENERQIALSVYCPTSCTCALPDRPARHCSCADTACSLLGLQFPEPDLLQILPAYLRFGHQPVHSHAARVQGGSHENGAAC